MAKGWIKFMSKSRWKLMIFDIIKWWESLKKYEMTLNIANEGIYSQSNTCNLIYGHMLANIYKKKEKINDQKQIIILNVWQLLSDSEKKKRWYMMQIALTS